MLETVLLSLGWGFGLLLLAPLVIAAEVARPGPDAPIEVQVDGRLLGGLVGVRLRGGPRGWRVCPLLLSLVPLPFLSLALGRDKPLKAARAGGKQPTRDEGGDEGDKADAESDGSGGMARRAAELRRLSGLILPPGLQLLSSLAGVIGLRRMRMKGRLGMGDPSVTGWLYGLLEGLGGALGRNGALQIQVTPEFRRKEMTGRVDLTLQLHLAYLLAIVLRFGLRVVWRWSVLRLAALIRFPFALSAK